METISEMMKKIMLAGIGAVATTAEKSKELLDELVEKGELTVEQGKILNEELKHNIKETIHERTAPTPKQEETSCEAYEEDLTESDEEEDDERKNRRE